LTGSADTGTENRNSLRREPVCGLLDELHRAAKRQRWHFLELLPTLVANLARGRGVSSILTPDSLNNFFIPISREQGELLYLSARAIGARRVAEFGTSFGISTLYLACAVRDNGGGGVIGSEIVPSKRRRAIEHLDRAGLGDLVDIRLGDALETLAEVPEPLDMLLLDGEKTLYLSVLKLLTPRLRPGALVMADNIFTFKKTLRPYVDHVQNGRNGFESTTLRIADGFEFSVYTG